MKNNMKKLKGMHSKFEDGEDERCLNNPFLAALANPDILSEDEGLYPERDFDAEEARAVYIEKFTKALATLTPKQRAVIDTLARFQAIGKANKNAEKDADHDYQQQTANALGITRISVATTLIQIQKKIEKVINKMEK